MPTKRKPRKMDRYLVSSQLWELRLVAKAFMVTLQKVKDVKAKVGVSRKKLYKALLSEML